MKLFPVVTLFALAALAALPIAAAEPAAQPAVIEVEALAPDSGNCNPLAGTLLPPWQSDVGTALGIPEPTPQHCTDCCSPAERAACLESCPDGCFCHWVCLDCNAHVCDCEVVQC